MNNLNLPLFSWDDFCHLLDSPSGDAGARTPATELPSWLTSSGQYFFETHSQKRALEVLCIKLSLLSLLCSLVADEHECYGRSRGVIGPEQVLVHVPQSATILPTRWTATVSLEMGGQEKLPSFGNMPSEMASGLVTMPASTNLAYAASQMKDWPMGKTMSVTALVQSADPIPNDDQTHMRGLIRVHVIADGIHGKDFSDRDVFRVSLPSGEGHGQAVELWARKVESPDRGIILSGMTDALSLDSWNRVTNAVGMARSSAGIAVYRAAFPAHDVYSCGMLLLRALLGAEEQRWDRACEHFSSIVYGLQPIVQGLDEDHYTIHVRVKDRLRESADCFGAGSIPEVIWWDGLVAVLRACSTIQGFSYASDTTVYEPSPARLLARDLESLARRARIELFEAGERDAMIVRVCDRAMDRLGAGV